jgi:hypothetical protein
MFAMSGDGSTDIKIPVVFLYGQEGNTLLELIAEYPDMVVHLEPSSVYGEDLEVNSKKAVNEPKKDEVAEEATRNFDHYHGSRDWEQSYDDDEGTDLDVEVDSMPELTNILKGVAHITELSVDGDDGGKLSLGNKYDMSTATLDGLEKVLNQVAGDLSKKYVDAVAADKKSKSNSFKIEKNMMESVLNQVIQKSIKAFAEVIDEKKYKVLEPVLGGVIKSMKNLNEAQEKLDRWLEELRNDQFVARKVSVNPLFDSKAFVRYLVTGST